MRAAAAQSAAGFDKFAGSEFGRSSAANAPVGPKPGMVSDNPSPPPAINKKAAYKAAFLFIVAGGGDEDFCRAPRGSFQFIRRLWGWCCYNVCVAKGKLDDLSGNFWRLG